MAREADNRADRLFADWMSEDQKWAGFEELLAGEAARQRDQAAHMLTLMECMYGLYPVLESQLGKLGWNDVVSGKLAPADFIHRVCLAKATGSTKGKL